ncbi:MAG: hypothetical protein HY738_22020 [Bacteroidia bacterium]|nr:hypothetical protein [Bacteroidia bacterium]
MINWIEEAEKKQQFKETLQQEREKMQEDYKYSNLQSIRPLLNELKILVDRVSKIAVEERSPSHEIGYTHIDGEEKIEFFGSAKFKKSNILLFKKRGSEEFISWRRVQFVLTDRQGLIKVKFYEKNNPLYKKQGSSKIKKKYIFRISKLKINHIHFILNWLAFKISDNEFYNSLPQRNSNHNSHDKRCFIASAVYGTDNCVELDILRNFRDEHLMNKKTGKILVELYYRISPPVANWLAANTFLKKLVRIFIIEPIVTFCRL